MIPLIFIQKHIIPPRKSEQDFTFDGPSLIFFIWSLYFISSASSLAIFLSTDSARESTWNSSREERHYIGYNIYSTMHMLTLFRKWKAVIVNAEEITPYDKSLYSKTSRTGSNSIDLNTNFLSYTTSRTNFVSIPKHQPCHVFNISKPREQL